MRPPRKGPSPVARPFRTATSGGHTVVVVHPGALAVQVYEGLANALPSATCSPTRSASNRQRTAGS